jgi:acyl-coenzyme A thioesterase PaaI-like protein
MATLIDDVGAAAIYSYGGHVKASVDLNISFLSTAKIQVHFRLFLSITLFFVCLFLHDMAA